MKRLSFDFIKRRAKEAAAKFHVLQKQHHKEKTIEDIEEKIRIARKLRELTPQTQYYSMRVDNQVGPEYRMTRSALRRSAFEMGFERITHKYPGEPRKRRRAIAWAAVRAHRSVEV